jgi:hypothetical protein
VPFEVQVELFKFAIAKLAAPIVPALCKEDQTLWRALGLGFRGCHCLLGGGDALLDEAPAQVRSLADGASRSRSRPALEASRTPLLLHP